MTNTIAKTISFTSIILCLFSYTFGQALPLAQPETVQMSSEKLNQIDGLVNQAIADKKMPGAVVLVGRKGKIVFRKAYGKRSLVPTVENMTVDTIFDVASLTKPIATATSIMILVEQGKLRLSDTIGDFIPDIDDENAKKVTIQQLLTHTSGYRPDFDLREKWTGRDGMLAALKKEKLRNPAGTKFVYSDIGFIVLGEIIIRHEMSEVVETDSEWFSKELIFRPLGLRKTFFLRIKENNDKNNDLRRENFNLLAPTENIKGQQNYLGSNFEGDEKSGNKVLRGEVHDPTAFRMGGVAGHAGLFSTADDLARYCQMLLNGGILDGKRVLSAATIAKMTKPYVISEKGDTRGLGWDIDTGFSSVRGELFPLGSFGHTGFTGMGVWIDRVSQTFVVFLSNRVHPDGKGDISDVRAKISTVAASAVEDVPIEVIRLAESVYASQVASQMEEFKSKISETQKLNNEVQKPNNAIVLNGIDVLEKENFKSLEGLKIGLVTNHTGTNLVGKTTIDILNEAKNVKLVSLFSPEHGIRGELDQSKISDSKDEKTGLPIYSLYGESRRPKPEQLAELDAIIFDIQDIGTRFYTYISTLRFVLEEAAKANKKVFVLDRPNPINGVDVEGAIADDDKLSFVATHTLPIRHGMTIGELALMMNSERKIGAKLEVVKMENWQRSMWFDETNQTWINPSPNMRSLTEATLYPGIGLLETTNLSVGRGTDTPFEIIGSPWLDGQKLAAYLNQKNLPGVRFVPVKFTPKSSVFKGEQCFGINIIITDRTAFESVKTGLEIALALRTNFPQDWKIDNYNRLLVNQVFFDAVKQGDLDNRTREILKSDLEEFRSRKAKFSLYK
ncbi:MAG: exo-beta-N-acetylmuramidase NamZ domain-containing protein [Aridibacter sp.]